MVSYLKNLSWFFFFFMVRSLELVGVCLVASVFSLLFVIEIEFIVIWVDLDC